MPTLHHLLANPIHAVHCRQHCWICCHGQHASAAPTALQTYSNLGMGLYEFSVEAASAPTGEQATAQVTQSCISLLHMTSKSLPHIAPAGACTHNILVCNDLISAMHLLSRHACQFHTARECLTSSCLQSTIMDGTAASSSPPCTMQVNVDTSGPVVVLLKTPSAIVSGGALLFSFSEGVTAASQDASTGGATIFQCQLQGSGVAPGGFSPCKSPV